MKKTTLCWMLIAVFTIAIAQPLSAEIPPFGTPMQQWRKWDEYHEGNTLYPGESLTYGGVEVTWEVTDEDRASTDSLGRVLLIGTSRSSWTIVPQERSKLFYLDEKYFEVELEEQQGKSYLNMEMPYQPSIINVAQGYGQSLVLSQMCPVQLDHFKLTISPKPVSYPDGSSYHELIVISNEAIENQSSDRFTMPLAMGTVRHFDRFKVEVREFYPETLTAILKISAQIDEDARGRWAYGRIELKDEETYGEAFDRLVEQFGFEVEWIEAVEGHPESIDAIKQRRIGQSRHSKGTYLKDFLTDSNRLNDNLAYEWVDDTHLKLWAKDYAKRVAREAVEKKEKQELERIFNENYKLATKVHRFERLGPAAARQLIEPQLNTYIFMNGPQWQLLKTEHPGNRYMIGRIQNTSQMTGETKEKYDKYSIAVSREEVIADERSGTLIVSAIPKTHKEIDALLAKMEGMITDEPLAEAPERYRIDLVLLRGIPGGAATSPTLATQELGIATKHEGTLLEFNVVPGMRVNQGDIIARFEPTLFKNRLMRFDSEYRSMENILNHLKDDMQAKQNAGEISRENAEKLIQGGETRLKTTQARLEKAKESYANQSTIVAPYDGTIVDYNRQVAIGGKIDANTSLATIIRKIEAPAAMSPTATVIESPESYGLTTDDLKAFGLGGVKKMGRANITLAGLPGEEGQASVLLSQHYRAELQFLDVRSPYLIVRGSLVSGVTPLIENTVFLERDKPSLLGLTNLDEALILILRLQEE